MKRIIYVIPNYSFFKPPILKALINLNFQVKLFDYYKPNLLARLIGLLATLGLIPRKTAQKKINQITNQVLIALTKTFKPQYILIIKGETISISTLKQLKKLGAFTINWFGDGLFYKKWMEKIAPRYNLFLNCCLDADKKLNDAGIKAYHLDYAADIKSPLKHFPKIYDITFCGQHTPRRERFLKGLIDLNLKIFGYARWQTSSLKDVASGPVSVKKVSQIISQSKIVVNLLTGSDKTQPNEINIRTFEALGNGTFLLVKDHPMLYRHFTPSKDFVTYTTSKDLYKKAKYYLAHPKQREKIAKHGYQTVKQKHTYEIRLKKLFKIVNQIK